VKRLFIVMTALCLLGSTAAAAAERFELEFGQLAPGVWAGVRPDSPRFPVLGNTTFVVSEAGVVVFDGGGLPVMAMVRPRGGDFLYSELEFEVMQADARVAAQCGAAGVVFGLLSADGTIDRERTARLIDTSDRAAVTLVTCWPLDSNNWHQPWRYAVFAEAMGEG